jgi:hypothetical protein
MSLFGGDGTTSQTQSPYDSESDLDSENVSSPSEHPPVETLSGVQSAQIMQNPQLIVPLGENDLSTDSETESEDDDEGPPARQNKFLGPPQTWKSYTAADRQIAASLNRLEEADLAIHLYNAHALKRRVLRPAKDLAKLPSWQSKDAWLKEEEELQYTDALGQMHTELVPPKEWTAWPLPPEELFTQHDNLRRTTAGQEDGQWFIDGTSAPDSGQDLREETLSLFLRLAKENWLAKPSQNGAQTAKDRAAKIRARARSKSVQSMRSQTDVKMKDMDSPETDHRESQPTKPKRGRKPQSHVYLRPAILADDTKALAISQPTINSMLERLDDVAAAIRRTRLNHLLREEDSSDASSQSEFTSDDESVGPSSRTSSRQASLSAQKKTSRPSSRSSSKAKQTVRRALSRQASLQDSDSASEYGGSPETSQEFQRRRKRSRSESTEEEDDILSARDWSGRAAPMDWSEVLGIAAAKGWDDRALARTAQRCAALFGESMSFAVHDESGATKPSTKRVHYTPTTIPAPRTQGIIPRVSKRPIFQDGTMYCPHLDCYGHRREFAMPYRVIEHCMRIHGYDPRTNDSDNEETTIGGVHVNNFLLPVAAKPGWKGYGRSRDDDEKRNSQSADQSEVDEFGMSSGVDGVEVFSDFGEDEVISGIEEDDVLSGVEEDEVISGVEDDVISDDEEDEMMQL